MREEPKVYVLRAGGLLVRQGTREEVVHEPLVADGCTIEDAILALAHTQDALKKAAARLAPAVEPEG